MLALLQGWLADERLADARLVVVTRRAVAAHGHDDIRDLAAAAVWGLVRTAQSEHPGRFAAGRPGRARRSGAGGWRGAVASGEPQLALRDGEACVPRLVQTTPPSGSPRPMARRPGGWGSPAHGTLDDLALVDCPDDTRPLGAGEVRVAVRAAGLNFRDVLIALGMYPGDAGPLGSEGAGVVLEVGPGTDRFAGATG